MTPTLAPSQPLTAADRCDRCGAQAYVRVVMSSGGELMFCAHHYRQHEAKLLFSGARVLLDQRGKLRNQESLV